MKSKGISLAYSVKDVHIEIQFASYLDCFTYLPSSKLKFLISIGLI